MANHKIFHLNLKMMIINKRIHTSKIYYFLKMLLHNEKFLLEIEIYLKLIKSNIEKVNRIFYIIIVLNNLNKNRIKILCSV
jgi:hypothetical protein